MYLTRHRVRRNQARPRLKRIESGERAGPRTLLELVVAVNDRLAKERTPSRAREEAWDFRRLVPFRRETWDALRSLGEQNGVCPGHLAAVLIERGLRKNRGRTEAGRSVQSGFLSRLSGQGRCGQPRRPPALRSVQTPEAALLEAPDSGLQSPDWSPSAQAYRSCLRLSPTGS